MYYILVNSCPALLCSRFNIHALPGTVIVSSQVDESQYFSLDQKDLQVFFDDKDVRELSDKECDLLAAVPQPRQRLLVLENEKWMQEGLNLIQVDSEVIISRWSSYRKAKVRYKGYIPEKGKGIYFGVEMKESSILTPSDGTYRDRRVFECEPGHGDFATISEIRLDSGRPLVPPKPPALPPVLRRAKNRVLQRPSSLPPLRFYPENDSPRPYSNPEEHGPIVTSSPRIWRKASLPENSPTSKEAEDVEENKSKCSNPEENLPTVISSPRLERKSSLPEILSTARDTENIHDIKSQENIKTKPLEQHSTSKSSIRETPPVSNIKDITIVSRNVLEQSKMPSASSSESSKHNHIGSSATGTDQKSSPKIKKNGTLHKISVNSIKKNLETSSTSPDPNTKHQARINDFRFVKSISFRSFSESEKDNKTPKPPISVKPQQTKSMEKEQNRRPSIEAEPVARPTLVKQKKEEKPRGEVGFYQNYMSMDSRDISPKNSYHIKKQSTIKKRNSEDPLSELEKRAPSPLKVNVNFEDLSDAMKTYLSEMITDVIKQYVPDDSSNVSQILNQSHLNSDVDSTAIPSPKSVVSFEEKPSSCLDDNHLTRVLELEKRVTRLESQLKLFEGFCGKYSILEKYLREQKRAQEALEQKVHLLENASKRRDAIEALSGRRVLSPCSSVSGTQTPVALSPTPSMQGSPGSANTTPSFVSSNVPKQGSMNTDLKTGISRTLFFPNESESKSGDVQLKCASEPIPNPRKMKEELQTYLEKEAQNQNPLDHAEEHNQNVINDSQMQHQKKSISVSCLDTETTDVAEKEKSKNLDMTESIAYENSCEDMQQLKITTSEDNKYTLVKNEDGKVIDFEATKEGLLHENKAAIEKCPSSSESHKRKKYTGENFKTRKNSEDETKQSQMKANEEKKNEDKQNENNVMLGQSHLINSYQNEGRNRTEIEEARVLITSAIEHKIKVEENEKESDKQEFIQTGIKSIDQDEDSKKSQGNRTSSQRKIKRQEETDNELQDSPPTKDEEKLIEPRKDQRRRVSPINSYFEHWKMSNSEPLQKETFNRSHPATPDSLKRYNEFSKTEPLKTKQMPSEPRTRVSIISKTGPTSELAKSRKTSAQERMDFLVQSLKDHSQSFDLADVLEQQVANT